ncbi:hypothetical protein C499_12780 [Halogeometricum borinquense DSM 11551]|uniref:Uncharacterized protein n=1 Tax=Halogeometricum borinquense (strain ATCC 700274 / DSM 11551 / JCM 10706 / KCTC 4070 / PR3) TaxID=469382 RepID=E4NWM9_HALBP|nr:hypothetical protein Hbor_37430 [Halogeometricum borinquense DSM 11551]ELY25757.1 hypothetical protein C499_12780 [Halogeometricum borinquense DSM 11551]
MERVIVKSNYPKMASGYKKDGEYKRGYKYATITFVGDYAPIVLGFHGFDVLEYVAIHLF